ncbi:MAG: amino acid adenylation domain-containing protein [Pseudomonadota bacterium]
MTLVELMAEAARRGIRFYLDGDKLAYQAASGAMDAVFRQQTVALKAELLGLLLDNRPAQQLEAAILPQARTEGAGFPLSFAQQRLWFIEQMGADSQYNIPSALCLDGALNVDALQCALDEIVLRHEVLRTAYASDNGQAVQRIMAPYPVALARHDLAAMEEGAQQQEVQRLAAEVASMPFELTSGVVLRAALLHLGPQRHVLLVTLHHIAADGWSMGVIVREFGALYEALCAGQPAALPPLAVQYADFAHWQRTSYEGEKLAQQLGYWQQRLQGLPQVHSLPLDRARPALQRFDGQLHVHTLDTALLERLRALGTARGATLFMVLQSAFALLLGRWSNEHDIVMGSPIAGRTHKELEGLVGLFVNTLVLRTTLETGAGFNALLDQARASLLDAYAHQELPFEKLVDVLRPERSLAHAPLFQIMFSIQSMEAAALRLGGLEVSGMASTYVATKFDLELSAAEGPAGLTLAWNSARSLFDAATIAGMADSFAVLLGAIAAAPDMPVGELPMVSAAEQARVSAWGANGAAFDNSACVHELFEAQAAATPDAPALACGELTLSYRELNEQANRMANRLREHGVGPDRLVGLHVTRSAAMLAGMLGILKAGGAYLPLDAHYPRARLDYMLQDSALHLLLTETSLLGTLALPPGGALCLDDAQLFDGVASANLARTETGLAPSHLAYVIYTSGSTGQPKGVMVEHGSVAGHARAARDFYALQASDRAMMFSSLGVDAALELPLCAWQAGAAVVLAGESILPPHQFLPFCAQFGITAADLPPAYIGELMPVGEQGADAWRATGLRLLVAGGEAFPVALIGHWRALGLFGRCRLVNAYGPTETTISASLFEVAADGTVALGMPLPGRVFSVRDPADALVPAGVAGELHISGPSLARGYLGQEALTTGRFGPADDRRYRTGDLVRWSADGLLQFAGRVDDQVKVRGFRVELGEIGACLRRHPSLRDAQVLVRGTGASSYLAAYVVPAAGHAADELVAQLRAFAREQLADFMLPAAYVVLDALPLMPNGKVDQRALPEPELGAGQEYVAPGSATESTLAAIWAELLGLDQVGIHANFFEIGGHSLLAMRMLSALSQQLDVNLPVRALFEHKTIAQLAAHIDQQGGGARVLHEAIPLAPRGEPLPPSFAQRRLWFIAQLEGAGSQYHIPAALRLNGELDQSALQFALGEIVRRHEVLRTTYSGDEGLQLIAPAQAPQLEITDLSAMNPAEREQELAHVSAAEAARPFDLACDLMLRVRLVRLAQQEHVLLVTLHHIAADGWSMGIIVREFGALYAAMRAGQASPLAELPLQYADYAHWQRSAGKEAARLEACVARLKGLPQVHGLPLDRVRPAQQRFEGCLHQQRLDGALLGRLKALAVAHDATLFMVLQSAFALLLGRWSNETDIVMGSPIAGRGHRDLEGLVGLFVNTLVLRTGLQLESGFDVLLEQGKSSLLDAYASSELPFEQLVDALQPERSLAHTPLFQVMFSLQNTEAASLTLPGLEVSGMAGSHVVSKFDLELSAGETDGQLAMVWNFATSLFDRATIVRMADSFGALLHAIADAPAAAVGSLPMVGCEDRVRLAGWNDTARAYRDQACMHQLFEEQAAATPDAPALVCGDVTLSYRELNERANRVAHYLVARGVGPDRMVGLCLERSLEMVIGMYGILKAGGAYVPLDPSYPAARLEFMLADAELDIVLTQRHLLGATPVPAGVSVYLDQEAQFAAFSTANPVVAGLAPSNLAYVIYTSGSTGQPKGVMVEHAGLVNRIEWMQNEYKMGAHDRVLQKTPFSFDVSVWELTWPFMVGACLVMARPEGHKDHAYLAALIAEQGITVLHFVPSMLGAMLESGCWPGCTSVRRVFCSGEALPHSVQRQFQQCHGAELHNLYGPTEASIDVSYWAAVADYPKQIVPIGRPIQNIVLRVLDPALNETPVGVAGELHIGGVGLARGYLNRSELNAEKFIHTTAGERLYKTGDIARFLPDGNLEYLGRIDHQVKLRGLRIELGEIESALRNSPLVAEAVVMARGTGADMRLVGYVQAAAPGADEHAFVDALQAELRVALPEFMVPAVFVLMAAFPLSANGKLDRKQLPDPDTSARAAERYVAPDGALETLLCDLWAQSLRRERVGAEDSYFAIGGDSIKAIALVSRMKAAGVMVTVRDLFAARTVRKLALLAGSGSAAEQDVAPFSMLLPDEAAGLAVLRDTGVLEDAYPLTRLQHGMLVHSQLDPESGTYHDVLNVRVAEALDLDAFRAALASLVADHAILRTVYALDGERALQLVYRHGDVHLEHVAFDPANSGMIAGLVERERQSAIVFEQALWKIILVELDPAHFQYILSFHHSMLDGWSVASFNTALFNRYQSIAAGVPVAAGPVAPLSYRYYVQQEQEALADAGASRYWSDLLDGAPLPWWSGRRAGATGSVQVPVGPQLSARLCALARRLDVQEKSVLQAAHLMVQALLSGQSDIVTSVVSNGRPERDGADLTLGLFLNSLPMRLRIEGLSWRELVLQAERAGEMAQPFRHYPLAQIQSDSRIDLSAALFNYTSFHVYESMERSVDAAVEQSFESNNYLFASEFSKGTGAGEPAFYLTVKADSGAFGDGLLERIGAYYRNVLEAIAADDTAPVARGELLGAAELADIAQLAGETAPARSRNVLQRFEAQAAATPDALALVFENTEYSYAQLDRMAESLADLLAARGVVAGGVVAVCLPRSAMMVAALLGVMKAGAAYLPLDPSHPVQRRAAMLADSGAMLLELDPEAAIPDSPARERSRHALSADSVAYLIYTSGSTGTPKGVAVGHAALDNFIEGANARIGLIAGQRWLAVTTVSFDIAGFELFGPLSCGAQIHLGGADAGRDAAYLAAYVEREAIDVLQATPSTWSMLVASGWQGASGLRALVGGEALAPELARELAPLCGRGLYNCYGPTEATIWSHIAPVVSGRVILDGLLPGYGHSVVDASLTPVARGVIGELVLTGASLADGYHGQPVLTGEKFTVSPSAALGGRRLYRTGDLVRRLDGERLEFLGRIDDQVKIRGYRIELGEIASRLRACELVREAVVIAAAQRLVAYVVPVDASEGQACLVTLRTQLVAALPDYMVPSEFVLLDQMPHTPNGKLDKKALPAPGQEPGQHGAPQGATETAMCAIWEKLLKRDRVGVTSSFFDLGGDSLLATRLLVQVNHEFACGLAIKDVFALRTVRELSLHVEVLVAQAETAREEQSSDSNSKEEIEW